MGWNLKESYSPITLFWDKNIPKKIPQVLRKLNVEHQIIHYGEKFQLSNNAREGGDDTWLNQIERDWIVITQDYNFHNKQNELYAIKQHRIGVFYIWGAEARQWDILRCFARAYDKIIKTALSIEKPFIYRVIECGRLYEVKI